MAAGEVLQAADNGWGATFSSPSGRRTCFRSQAPQRMLDEVVTSKAFIFWLEMLAQVFAIVAGQPSRGMHLLCFCDNVAAEHALRKGYSQDGKFTKVLACFWSWGPLVRCR